MKTCCTIHQLKTKSTKEAGLGHSCHWEATPFPNLKQTTLTSGFCIIMLNKTTVTGLAWLRALRLIPFSRRMVDGRPPDLEYFLLGLGAER